MDVSGIRIKVNRKDIRYIRLYVHADGRVVLNAPIRCPDETLRKFIDSKWSWIERRLSAFPEPAKEKAFISGETHYLWGEPYTLELAASGRGVTAADGKITICAAAGADCEKILDGFYRERLKLAIPALAERWHESTGLRADEVRIKKMRTRWGSCNTEKRRIWLGLELAKKPEICLDYVFLHELAHLVERGHNAAFYALMDKFMPDWREVKMILNRSEFK
jgi:predicted metal-dependent hydrolase